MAVAYDPIYDDLEAEFANEEVMGGTGEELATEQFQPGFMYTGPAVGEAAARAQYETPVGPPNYLGNAYAHQAALDFDRRQAEAQAQRDIEDSYKEARTAQQFKAVQMARDYQTKQEMSRLVESGMNPAQAALQVGAWNTPGQLGKLIPDQDAMPKTMNVRGTVVTIDPKTGLPTSTFTPPSPAVTQGPMKAFPVVDEQTGERIPGIAQVQMPNGNIKTFKTTAEQERGLQLTIPIPGENILQSGQARGTPTQLREAFGPTSTNLPSFLRQGESSAMESPTSTTQEIIRKVGNRLAVFDQNTKRFIRYVDASP